MTTAACEPARLDPTPSTFEREMIHDLAPRGRVQHHLAARIARLSMRVRLCDAMMESLMTALFAGGQLPASDLAAFEQTAAAAGIPAEHVQEMLSGNAAMTLLGKMLTQVDRALRIAQRACDQALMAWHREQERVIRRAMLEDRRQRVDREAAAKAARKATTPPRSAEPAAPAAPAAPRESGPLPSRAERGLKPLPVGAELERAIKDLPLRR